MTALYRWLYRLQPSESYVMGGAALLVGLSSGMGIWLFKRLIDLAHWLAFEGVGAKLSPLGGWTLVLVPLGGGVLVGLIKHCFIGEERHHGVAGIMEVVALAGGRLRYRRVPAKAVAAALSIGSGASVGPEDPSVQIGANLGSLFGQWLNLSDERVRILVAAGAAGGIAAAFNAPIAAVFFALEIILGELSGSALGIVVLAAVISSVFTQAVSGEYPAFTVPAYAFNSAWELPLYLGLGLLAGPVAAVYIRALYVAHDAFHNWRAPGWVKPALAGLIVGLVGTALGLPQLFGVGYETIESILDGATWPVLLLMALLAAKLVLTSVSIGGGFVGGVFAPSLFLGATLGGAYGQVCARLFPALSIAPPAFAMVGMAAVLAGAVHAPLTAILLLFEMTRDYRIILPLMFAVVISQIVSQRLQRDSVYTLGLARKGIRLERGRDIDVMESVRVGDVMLHDTLTLSTDFPVARLADHFLQTGRHGFAVLDDDGSLFGMVSVEDYRRAVSGEHGPIENLAVRDVATRKVITVFPDDTLGTALRCMAPRDLSRLPVVANDDPRHLLGVVRRSDIVRAYDAALAQRAARRHRVQQVQLGARVAEADSLSVEEATVEAGAPCIGKRMSEIAWPRECIIATLRRGRQVLFPHGDTALQAGDVLVYVAEGEAREMVRRMCSAARDL
ncbi:MAG: chloride channel protein [Thermoflexales bacterium]|nr:chloride channel protein [Thermoflexales bacterium]